MLKFSLLKLDNYALPELTFESQWSLAVSLAGFEANEIRQPN